MALNAEAGRRALELITSRFDDWRWRKKIEKMLSLPPSGFSDDTQRAIFLYLKANLKAYKSRRADPDTWMVGGFVTKEVIERARFNPKLVGADITKEDVAFLGTDPGAEVDQAWWDDMLVWWFEEPGAQEPSPDKSEGPAKPEARTKPQPAEIKPDKP
jgi:hypothetical protein